MIWYFENDRGCGLRDISARTEENAKRILIRETGTYDPPKNVRLATPDDKAWIEGMGGHVPTNT